MKHVRVLIGTLMFVPSLVLAQAQGRVKGIVSDTSGKPIVGATIKITCPEITNFVRSLTSNAEGEFATIIADGTKQYLFHVEAGGYQPVENMVKPLIGGQTLERNFSLTSVKEIQDKLDKEAMEQPGIRDQREAFEILKTGKKAEARAKFETAVAAMPELYISWLELGKMDIEAGNHKAAIEKVDSCLAASFNFPACLALGLNAARALGDKALIEKYESAYKLANPTDPTIAYNEAVEYLNKGDDAKARPLLEQALQADPNYGDALFQLGMVYFRLGEAAKAKETLQKFLEVAPTHKEAPTATEMLKYM
jgi:Tfp pilus assembly protein PilF